MSAKSVLENMTEQDYKIIALEATVAQQTKMIEHLRGGPTPLYTINDVANADASGFKNGRTSVGLLLSKGFNTLNYIGGEYSISMTFHHGDDARAAFTEIATICRLAGEE